MTQFLTASYAIRKPTARKEEVMNLAVDLYTQSAQRLLDWCFLNLEFLQDEARLTNKDGERIEKYNADSIKRAFPSLSSLRLPLASAVNEALITDVSSVVASYLELVKSDPRTEFPTADKETIENEEDYKATLDEISFLGDNLKEEERLFALLTSKRKTKGRPICYDRSRDFSLLCKPDEAHELYAWLPLLPGENTIIPRYHFDGNMIDLATGEPFTKRSSVGVIVKLYIPNDSPKNWYNKRFLTQIISGFAKIKSAKLIKLEHSWKLNVSIQFETPKAYEHDSYIGVALGSMERVGYAITSLDGVILKEHLDDLGIFSLNASNRRYVANRQRDGKFVDVRHYKAQSQTEMLHKIVDRLLDIAKRNKSMLVVEDFSVKKGANTHIKRGGRMTKLAAPWRKFEFILSYKANLAGVPVRLNMWSAQATKLCVSCGSECVGDLETRYQIMQCSACMQRKHKQLVSSINLCRRMLYVKKQWDSKGGYVAFHRFIALKLSQP